MARDWSKQRNRDNAAATRRAEVMLARELADYDGPRPSKADLREEAAVAVAQYRGPVRRLPTVIELKCYACNHRGRVTLPYGNTTRRFRCGKCGALSL